MQTSPGKLTKKNVFYSFTLLTPGHSHLDSSHLRLKGLALRVEVAVIGQTEECCQGSIRIIAWSLKGFGRCLPRNRRSGGNTSEKRSRRTVHIPTTGCRCNSDMVPVAAAKAAAKAAAAAVSPPTANTYRKKKKRKTFVKSEDVLLVILNELSDNIQNDRIFNRKILISKYDIMPIMPTAM
ncbi:hypothetical protein V1478_005958 [Vespula squamosa]|uniref:Uncharacterized protein n=1 Tax=Vespula squamosa TaxID=30214 RepID=A0ABD2B8V8_VESSQ